MKRFTIEEIMNMSPDVFDEMVEMNRTFILENGGDALSLIDFQGKDLEEVAIENGGIPMEKAFEEIQKYIRI